MVYAYMPNISSGSVYTVTLEGQKNPNLATFSISTFCGDAT